MDTLKHHHIKFKERPKSGSPSEWEFGLKKLKGIKRISIDVEKGDLFAEYDLFECKEEDIERYMAEAGFVLEDTFKERVKRGWIHFTEENEQSEFRHKAPACCDMTEIEEKRKK